MFAYIQRIPSGRLRVRRTPYYREIAVSPCKNGQLPWRAVLKKAGGLPLVVPRGVTPPADTEVFTGTALRRIWMTRAAVDLLRRIPPEKRRVAVYDRDAAYPETVLNLAPQAGELLVVTARRGGFETVAATVMRRYGAAICFVSPAAARLAQLAVAPSGLWANLPRPPVTLSGADCAFENVFDGYTPPPAYRVQGGTPRLYDALYQLAHVRELAHVFPTAVCDAGKTLDIARGV